LAKNAVESLDSRRINRYVFFKKTSPKNRTIHCNVTIYPVTIYTSRLYNFLLQDAVKKARKKSYYTNKINFSFRFLFYFWSFYLPLSFLYDPDTLPQTHIIYSNAIRDNDVTADNSVSRSSVEIAFRCVFPIDIRLGMEPVNPTDRTISTQKCTKM